VNTVDVVAADRCRFTSAYIFQSVRILDVAAEHLLAEIVARHRVEKRVKHAVQVGERVCYVFDGEEPLAVDWKAVWKELEAHVERVYGQPAHAEQYGHKGDHEENAATLFRLLYVVVTM
jgi:hypothetical protein